MKIEALSVQIDGPWAKADFLEIIFWLIFFHHNLIFDQKLAFYPKRFIRKQKVWNSNEYGNTRFFMLVYRDQTGWAKSDNLNEISSMQFTIKTFLLDLF